MYHRLFYKRKKGAFIELLLVVAILALLAIIGLSKLEDVNYSKRMSDATNNNELLICGQGQMMDVDGNLYDTVEIGGICWMAENLKYLPSVSPSSENSISAPIYYVYGYQGTNVNKAKAMTNFQEKGVLYNWPAAIDACPPGTRLPTDDEYHILESTLATDSCDPDRTGWDCEQAGLALKTSAWGGNNSSGFTAIPAGYRSIDGNFYNLNSLAFFWSSFEYSFSHAWRYTLLFFIEERVHRGAFDKARGFSVRCVR